MVGMRESVRRIRGVRKLLFRPGEVGRQLHHGHVKDRVDETKSEMAQTFPHRLGSDTIYEVTMYPGWGIDWQCRTFDHLIDCGRIDFAQGINSHACRRDALRSRKRTTRQWLGQRITSKAVSGSLVIGGRAVRSVRAKLALKSACPAVRAIANGNA